MKDNNSWMLPVEAKPPALGDNTADTDRILNFLASQLSVDRVSAGLSICKVLPGRLRELGYSGRALVFGAYGRWDLLEFFPPGGPSSKIDAAGLAVDLGTTRIVMRLIDLETGATLGQSALDNPQAAVGPDILTRIHHADKPGGLEELHSMVVAAISDHAALMCESAGIENRCVRLVAVSGNTTMTHFFLGLPARWIIREPYIPAVNRPAPVAGAEVGFSLNPDAVVYLFPNVGSYFGGDLLSGAYYAGFHESEEIAMLMDVGTNAEVLLGNKDWLVACAGAAGPALESGMSAVGMTAGPGVIDRVTIDPETREISYHTIGDQKPKGFCGSAMIDLAAQLFLAGMIDFRGKLVPGACRGRLIEEDGIRSIIVVDGADSATGKPLAISQVEVDSLIRSKAAMYTILETITGYVGIEFADISKIYVAGTFGSFIDPESAITIGMIPDLPRDRFKVLGNSSLEGAARLLSDRRGPDIVAGLAEKITYMELNVNQEFMNRFSAAKFLPHTDPDRFPSVRANPGRG